MSDERLRERERLLDQSRTVSDEAAFLAERVRAGTLSPALLRLACYAGHPAAVYGCEPLPTPDDFSWWVRGLEPWGPRAWLTATSVASSAVLNEWETEFPDHPEPRRALSASLLWLKDPADGPASEANVAGRLAERTAHLGLGSKSGKAAAVAALLAQAVYAAHFHSDGPMKSLGLARRAAKYASEVGGSRVEAVARAAMIRFALAEATA